MLKFFNRLEETIICLLLASMTLLVFVEVILRFGFSTGLMWAQELTLLLSAWMVLFGASYGIKVGSHIGVDAVVKLLPSGLHRAVSAIAVLGCLCYCGFFAYGSWVYLEKIHLIGIELEDMPVPKWIAHSILLLGLGLLTLRFLILLWQIITGKAEGFKLVDEAEDSMYLIDETQENAGKGEAS